MTLPCNRSSTPLMATCYAVIGYAVWAHGGTLPALQPPMLALGALTFLILLGGLREKALAVLSRDPLFWIGLAFLLMIVVQMANSGRVLYFNPVEARWVCTAPPLPYAPSSFIRLEAFEMLCWFAPAWVLALTVRHAPDRERLANALLLFVVLNGALFALAGVIQWMRGMPLLFWHTEPGTRFYFATFFYRNHAGSFMALTLAATLGLLAYHIRWRRNASATVNVPAVWGLGAVTVLLVIAMHTALSRAGILVAWALVGLFLIVLFLGMANTKGHSGRLQIGAVMMLTMAIAISWATILGGDALGKRAQSLHTWSNQVQGRYWQWDAAVRMWQDYPVWGVGGWGYRHLLPLYIDASLTHHLRNPGKANVHNDPLQFLAEFGLAGLLLLLAAATALAVRFIRAWRSVWKLPIAHLYFFSLAGVILVIIHSFIDLPFRNPAILFTCVILLGAVPAGWSRLHRRSRHTVML